MKERSLPLFILVAVITAVAALYVAKAILLPLALAILLTFLLTPLADRLERWRIPRVPAVLGVVGISFAILGTLGWVVTAQLVQLGSELPAHEENLKSKIRSLRPDSPTLNRVSKTVTNLRETLTQTEPEDDPKIDPPQAAKGTRQSDGAPDSAATGDAEPPVAVQVVDPASTLFARAQEWIGQLVAPITTAALVVVLTLFLLLDRENQRSRFVQLFGRAHMHATAEAVHDVSRRVGRYLRMLFLLNAGFGLVVAAGLWVIGVPGAVMWGVLGFSFRFLPYIGPWIAATLPILVSIATADGWTQPLLVVGWYVIIELLSNNIVEPLVYGNTTGVSTVGVIIAAIFWTWLWGPLGLILSMPMTVSLLVAARYVPQLRFLTILLADRPPQSPAERVYQRLLAFDDRGPLKLARKQVEESTLVKYYDHVLLPALAMAEQDRHADLLNDDQAAFVLEATEDMIDELGELAPSSQEVQLVAETRADAATGGDVVSGPTHRPARVLCIPLRDDADEMASRMLVQLLRTEGFPADRGAADALTGEMVDRVAASEIDIVVISVLPPIAPRDSRLLWKRLRTRYPKLPIVVGFWTAASDKEALAEPVEDSASRVVTTLAEAVAVVRGMAAQLQLAAKSA
jgi:predicted PurR-regulated permease PerM